MKDQIQDIISRFGPRLAGTDAERRAQEYVAAQMKEYTDDVHIEIFKAPLTAKFGKMRWYAFAYMASLVLFLFSPLAAMILALTCAIVLIFDLMRNDGIADFLFPMHTSRNVYANLEPSGSVTSTLIFSGHMDSTQECTWWYKLKQYGAWMTIGAGLLIVFYAVFLVWFIATAQDRPVAPHMDFNTWIYFTFVILSPITLIYHSFHGTIVVDGACDNLSGVVIAKNIFASFADPAHKGRSILKNTRIRFISFGAEEKGIRGSSAYCKSHINELRDENAHLLNIDSVRLPDQISIITAELMSFILYDSSLISKTEKAFHTSGISYKKGALPMGGTDAIAFQQRRIPALTIIGMNMKSLDPTYHTRLDTIDNVDQTALDNVKKGLCELVVEWDRA